MTQRWYCDREKGPQVCQETVMVNVKFVLQKPGPYPELSWSGSTFPSKSLSNMGPLMTFMPFSSCEYLGSRNSCMWFQTSTGINIKRQLIFNKIKKNKQKKTIKMSSSSFAVSCKTYSKSNRKNKSVIRMHHSLFSR